MKKYFFLASLLALGSPAFSQFNTIRKIRILPQVQVDTTTAQEEVENQIEALEPIDSVEFNTAVMGLGRSVSMPLANPIINSRFGSRVDPFTKKRKFHLGLDFKGSSDSVMVIMPGIVKTVAYSRGLGNYIEVEHGDFTSIYGHLSFILVRRGMRLDAGNVLAITGSTGRSTGEHLHFAIKYKGRFVNPTPFLDVIYQKIELQARSKTAGLSVN